MLSDIYRNQGLFKALFLTVGFVLIVFCFFCNVGEFNKSTSKSKYYYTFSARYHSSSSDGIDCYQDIDTCNGDGFCNTVKTTPYLGGFALGFIGLVLIFSFGESIISRVIKKYHIWIIQLVFLFLAWALLLIIPILYHACRGDFQIKEIYQIKNINTQQKLLKFQYLSFEQQNFCNVLYFHLYK